MTPMTPETRRTLKWIILILLVIGVIALGIYLKAQWCAHSQDFWLCIIAS
jgi:hypothetical protein